MTSVHLDCQNMKGREGTSLGLDQASIEQSKSQIDRTHHPQITKAVSGIFHDSLQHVCIFNYTPLIWTGCSLVLVPRTVNPGNLGCYLGNSFFFLLC